MGMLVANPVRVRTPGNVLNELREAHDLIDGGRTQAMQMKRKKDDGVWLDGSTLTPSMWSVVSQIKKRDVKQVNGEIQITSSILSDGFSAGTVSKLIYDMSGTVNASKEDSFVETNIIMKDAHGLMRKELSHPLSSEENCIDNTRVGGLPYTKLINLQDLDLRDTITREDIVEEIKPIYERPKNVSINKFLRSSRESRNSFRNYTGVLFHEKVVEMEQWPSSKHSMDLEATLTVPDSTVHRRVRQQSLNPSFLKLYALETDMKRRNIIPDLNVDETILDKLSYDEIKDLDIPTDISNAITAEQVKLALITRKKLWSEMCHITRTDLHGEYTPSNLKFVKLHDDITSDIQNISSENSSNLKNKGNTESRFSSTTSLVRINSEVKPWSQPQMSQPTMFKPCGRISLGKCTNNKELQYVVKGWCDYRFA